jgi:archaellum biogenesis protein FlaJ (TadC family)
LKLRPWPLGVVVVLSILALGICPSAHAAHPTVSPTLSPASAPLVITPVSPKAGSAVASLTPNITAAFTDSNGMVLPSSVLMFVDGLNVTGVQSFVATASGVYYQVPSILKLHAGSITVNLSASDALGNHASVSWQFQINLTAISSQPLIPVNVESILVDIGVIAGIAALCAGGYVFYLQRTRKFTFRKYFATHPVKREYVVLYIPVTAAFVFVLLGLIYITGTTGLPLLAPEYVFIAGFLIALTAFAIDSRREKILIRARERAFAQFLFEMADAMRGGIDPAKSVIELSKSTSNILSKPLRIAADQIRLGRSFETVLTSMVSDMKSPLVSRYAELIAEASNVGGETSTVVYRAAKDMDDFIKIEVERGQQLLLPIAVLYIAFGVLMAVLFALLYIAPTLGSISISFVGGNPLAGGATGGSAVPKLDPATLKVRFFDLMLIISIGTGAIIGAFTEGKARYGLLHSIGLTVATVIAFLIVFP